jgi:L-asparagine transporter-like permease
MISLGGVIGVGMFLGSGAAVRLAGPGVVVSYALGGLVMMLVMFALGEMSVAYPVPGSFRVYASDYLGPFFGFVTGWVYWASWVGIMSAEIVSHLRFRPIVEALEPRRLKYRAPGFPYGSGLAAVLLVSFTLSLWLIPEQRVGLMMGLGMLGLVGMSYVVWDAGAGRAAPRPRVAEALGLSLYFGIGDDSPRVPARDRGRRGEGAP